MPKALPPTARFAVILLVVLAAFLLWTWPLVARPFFLLGHPMGETDNHLWMFWMSVQRLRDASTAWSNFPEGIAIPLMDPVNLPFYLLGAPVDPALGFNLAASFNILLGIGSGYLLCREWSGASASVVGAVTMGFSPFLAGVIDFGITEAWPLWLLSLHLTFLHRTCREGGWRSSLLSGLALAGFCLSGWYHAFFALLVELTAVPWWVRDKGKWKWVFIQGLVATLLLMPSLVGFLSVRDFWSERWRLPWNPPRRTYEAWRSIPLSGTDVLNLVLPNLRLGAISHSCYLGLGALFLAIIACFRHARLALPLLLGTLVLLLLSLGHWPRMGGHLLGGAESPLAGPSYFLVHAAPFLQGLTHWYRAVGPATILLGPLVAMGAEAILGSSRAILLAPLLFVETMALGGNHWPRTTHDPRPPAIYLAIPAEGPIVELPFDNARKPFTDTPPRRYNLWQPYHGHANAENYESRDAILFQSAFVASLDRLCGLAPTVPLSQLPPEEMRDSRRFDSEESLGRARELLVSLGLRWIILHEEACPGSSSAIELLDRAFGPPYAIQDSARAWEVRGSNP